MSKKLTVSWPYVNFGLVLIVLSICLVLALLGYKQPATIGVIAISIIAILPEAREMIKTLMSGQVGVDIIALVAIGASLLLGQYVAAAVIVIMLTGGNALEEFAKNRARKELDSLLKRKPTIAHLIVNGQPQDVPVDKVKVDDSILLKPGDMIPVDGKIYKGFSSVDESAITGESLPENKKSGDEVLSGSINLDGVIEIHATKISKESQYETIIKLVSEASTKKSPLVRLADVYSLPFTIITFVMAAIAWIISGDPVRALSVLVVATPCPLLIATPVAIVSGMSRAASRGVIIKSGGVLEQLSRLKAIAFDKTGTVTQGKPTVMGIDPCEGVTRDELLKIAASVEKYSTHTLAQVVVDTANSKKLSLYKVEKSKEIPGKGITAEVKGKKVFVGSFALLKESGIDVNSPICVGHSEHENTALYVASGNKYLGSISFVDPLRAEAKQTIADLKSSGVKNFIMITGDRKQVGEYIGNQLGITKVESEVLPADKVNILLAEKKKYSPIAMVGDGINDAPVLAASDVGVALGAKGSTAASEAADAVIMQDDLGRLSELVAISKRSVFIAKQSIFTGMGLSSILMVFAVAGFIVPVAGAFMQEAIDVIVILNALRARFRPKVAK
ncbi:cobalt ABC transporter ATP-binding protein [Candidatus Saccharibacteria bacterium]|nr:cobalt ABC transporter ATP-binding protein [Candidatus Saccharibacteria bacterium]